MTSTPGFHAHDTAPIPTTGETVVTDADPLADFYEPHPQQQRYVQHEPVAAPRDKPAYLRGCGVFALVVLVLVAVLVAVGLWAGQKLWQAGEDALFGAGEDTTSAPAEVAAAPAAVAPPIETEPLPETDPSWVTDQARRIAFSTATATEHGLVGADPAQTYEQITGLCTTLDAGAEPASTLIGFVDEHSSAVTATPMAKIVGTGLAIQCPSQYTAAAQQLQALAPEVEIPEAPSFSWLL